MDAYQFSSYQHQMSNMIGGLPDINDLTQIESMEFDFSTYVQQPEVMT
jgi:hypothetical protein